MGSEDLKIKLAEIQQAKDNLALQAGRLKDLFDQTMIKIHQHDGAIAVLQELIAKDKKE